jgi:hypothetical protein
MHRLLRISALALVVALAVPAAALAAVRGLVIKDNGSIIVQVVDGSVLGEISVPPGQISNNLEFFWLDDALNEYQPTHPPYALTIADGDVSIVDVEATGTWTFNATGHDPGESETTFILTQNGSPVYTSPAVPTHCEEAHVEADGFVLRQNGVNLVHVWRGTVTGQLPAHLGQTSPEIDVIFLSPDSIEFIPDEPQFTLVLDIADSSVVKWRPEGQWGFHLIGSSVGTTDITLKVHHIDHDDFVSPTLTAQTYASVGVDPRRDAEDLSFSAPMPNPVHGSARLEFSIPRPGRVELAIYDISGRLVSQVANGQMSPGRHAVEWHAGSVKPGLYFARLRTADGERMRRIVVSH